MKLTEIRERAVPVLKQAAVKKAGVFGSYARGEQTPKSDVDILVEYKEGTNLFDVVDLRDKLQASLGKSVDLVGYKTIKPRLKNRILAEQIVIL